MNTIELRNYLLKTGKRDLFIKYFKDHFVESQNVLGAYTPGLFRIKDEEERFFWIRGFDSMQERSRFLPAFYGGEVWKAFGPAANDMMLEWHNVHLVKPLWDNMDAFAKRKGVFVIDYYKANVKQLNDLIDLFNIEYIPLLHGWGVNTITLLVSEMTENDFPKLPVYQDENLLVVVTAFNNETEYESTIKQIGSSDPGLNERKQKLTTATSSIVLYPVT